MRPDRCGVVISVSKVYAKLVHVNPLSYQHDLKTRVKAYLDSLMSAGWLVHLARRDEADGRTLYELLGRQERIDEYKTWEQELHRLRSPQA